MTGQDQSNGSSIGLILLSVAVGALCVVLLTQRKSHTDNVVVIHEPEEVDTVSAIKGYKHKNHTDAFASQYPQSRAGVRYKMNGLGTRVMISDFGVAKADRQRVTEIEPSEFICQDENGGRLMKIAIVYNEEGPVEATLFTDKGTTPLKTVSISTTAQVADFTIPSTNGIDRVVVSLNANQDSASIKNEKIFKIEYHYNVGSGIGSVVTETVKFARSTGTLLAHQTRGVKDNRARKTVAAYMNGHWEFQELANGQVALVKIADWDTTTDDGQNSRTFTRTRIDGQTITLDAGTDATIQSLTS